MGHERIGTLPRTRKWRAIVDQIAAGAETDIAVSDVARQTISNVRRRFRHIQEDEATKAAFTFLVDLAITSRQSGDAQDLLRRLPAGGIRPTPLRLAGALRSYTAGAGQRPEYSTIADSAAIDAIALWYEQNVPQQQNLFESLDDPSQVWHKAGSGAGFCELSRLFFSKFVERYLNYFLEREASQVLPSDADRNRFSEQMAAHLDAVSQHAFETSKITQSYAAGWFNKHAAEGRPSSQEITGFLAYAFGKLTDELMREGSEQ